MSKIISTIHAPQFPLPFSQAIHTGDFVYVSGQAGVSPETLKPAGESFQVQAEQCFRNLKAILEGASVTMEHVIKFNVHVSDIKYFAEFNEIYKRWVKPPYPARTTVVSGLGIYLIEIDCIAFTQTVRGE